MNAPDLGLVYVSLEDHVIHVGDCGDCRTVVEVVRLDNGVTYFHRDIQYHTGDGTTDLRGTGYIGVLGDTVTNNFQCALRVRFLLDRL